MSHLNIVLESSSLDLGEESLEFIFIKLQKRYCNDLRSQLRSVDLTAAEIKNILSKSKTLFCDD